MTTRPLKSLQFARATVTLPDGSTVVGQTTVHVPSGVIEVVPRTAPNDEPLTFAGGEVTKQGSYGWLVSAADGDYVVQREAGACGSCGGRR